VKDAYVIMIKNWQCMTKFSLDQNQNFGRIENTQTELLMYTRTSVLCTRQLGT